MAVVLLIITLVGVLAGPASAQTCPGDCDEDGTLAVDELLLGVGISLGSSTLEDCETFDANGDDLVQVHELVLALGYVLSVCPGQPTRTPTPTSRVTTPAATLTPTPSRPGGTATIPPSGDEFQINTYTSGVEGEGQVGVASNGDFVAVWEQGEEGPEQDGDQEGVFGQRFSSAGVRIGTEFQVNSTTTGGQDSPSVAVAPNGAFVVVWGSPEGPGEGFGFFVLGQRFDSSGAPAGTEFRVDTYTPDEHAESPHVATAGQGFVVVWDSVGDFGYQGRDGYLDAIVGQRYDNAGARVGSEFLVNTYTTNSQSFSQVAAIGGGFVVVWESGESSEYPSQDGDKDGIFGQRFNSAGGKVGPEFQVNTYSTGGQQSPTVAGDATGRFIVTWEDERGFSGQLFDSGGNRVGSELQLVLSSQEPTAEDLVFAFGTGGGLLAVWEVETDGDGQEVLAQRFSSTGTRVGTEFQINVYTTGDQDQPNVASLPNGGFIVVWEDDGGQDGDAEGVFGRILSATP